MTKQPKYLGLLENEKVRRWYENLNARSYLTATTWLRTLGLYCVLENTAPDKLLKDMDKPDFRDKFADFVRKMEREGKAGSYIIRFKKVLRSFGRFNGKNLELNINIANDHLSPTIENERVPNKDELSRLLRKATSRGRVSISLMAYAGLRPESLGNYEGTDGLRLKDIKGLRLTENIEFDKIPIMNCLQGCEIKPLLSAMSSAVLKYARNT